VKPLYDAYGRQLRQELPSRDPVSAAERRARVARSLCRKGHVCSETTLTCDCHEQDLVRRRFYRALDEGGRP